MIQRIQSIFLLFSALLAMGTIALPELEAMNMEDLYVNINNWTSVGVAFLCLVTIFLYNNRPMQIKLSYAAILLALASIGSIIAYYFLIAGGDLNWNPSAAMHPLVLVFITLAIRWIRKDEKLVKSLDRLR